LIGVSGVVLKPASSILWPLVLPGIDLHIEK